MDHEWALPVWLSADSITGPKGHNFAFQSGAHTSVAGLIHNHGWGLWERHPCFPLSLPPSTYVLPSTLSLKMNENNTLQGVLFTKKYYDWVVRVDYVTACSRPETCPKCPKVFAEEQELVVCEPSCWAFH